MGLYDMIMIKDNHVDYAGGIPNAIDRVEKYLKDNKKKLSIVCEVRNFNDIETALNTGRVDRIMLDNFTIEETRNAVRYINGRLPVESSGGITLEELRAYAKCGVDFISVGALTHQISSLDLSLKATDF